MMFGVLEILCWLTLGGSLTIQDIFIILETNYSESIGYVSANFALSKAITVIFYLGIGFYLLYNEKALKIEIRKIVPISILFVLVILIILFKISKGDVRGGFPSLYSSVIIYYDEINSYKDIANKRKMSIDKIVARSKNNSKKQFYVLIIGESLRRDHMSLYNYPKNTNPLLKSRKDLIIFADVISCRVATASQLVTSLTLADVNTPENDFWKYYSLLDIGRAAGFKTYWISNQDPLGLWENETTILASTADEVYFVKNVTKLSETGNQFSLDEKILPVLKKILEINESKKMIVIHLMGNHLPYKHRYPISFNKFNNNNSDKDNIISEYDNSVLYNDYVVNEIFNILKQHSNHDMFSASLYFSDHGQILYDSPNDNYIGHYKFPVVRCEVEIPFILWLSESFTKEKKEKFNNIIAAKDFKFMTDDLEHSFLDLMGIESTMIIEQKSLFSNKFNARKRIIYGVDYDKELKNAP